MIKLELKIRLLYLNKNPLLQLRVDRFRATSFQDIQDFGTPCDAVETLRSSGAALVGNARQNKTPRRPIDSPFLQFNLRQVECGSIDTRHKDVMVILGLHKLQSNS